LIAYPTEPRDGLLALDEGALRYRVRLGDDYFKLAFTMGVGLDLMREANGLWRLQPLLPGAELTIPVDPREPAGSRAGRN
jgi:hypothetical protein